MIKNPNQSLAHRFDHLSRVQKRSLLIAEILEREQGITIDRYTLSLAAILHDIDQPFDDKESHAERSAVKAGEILDSLDLPHHIIEKVQKIIREHSSEDGKPPETWEGKVLFDADKLDGLGEIGIMRVFKLCGQMGLTPEETIEWYERKIQKALPLMQTDIAKKMGKDDFDYVIRFIEQFKKGEPVGERAETNIRTRREEGGKSSMEMVGGGEEQEEVGKEEDGKEKEEEKGVERKMD